VKEKKIKIKKKITGQKILRIGVNSFLYFLIGILAILLITFGFTQTSVFRGWLKDTIVEEINSGMNGKISIDKLEGTIFTSIVLKNTLLTQNNDTVFTAEHIEVKTSPLKILFKIIYARKIEIRNSAINLKEDSDGTLNVAKLFLSSEEEDTDTTSSAFPFAFQVADLQLNNIAFTLQEYSKINSNSVYESMNMADFRISDLYLHLSAYADMNKNSYQVKVSEFTFNPNFKFFNLKSLRGEFFATENGVLVNELNIITEKSELSLNAGITDVNLFSDFTNEELSNAPVRIKFESEKFNFDDVSTFIPDFNFMRGEIVVNLFAEGSLNNLSIDDFLFTYNKTNLKMRGVLSNILDSDNLFINANLNGSIIDPADPSSLFASLDIPVYSDFGVVNIDTLIFTGNPADFRTVINLNSEKANNIKGNVNLNFQAQIPTYNVDLETKNFNLQPFASIKTNLNSSIKVKGSGFDLNEMNSDIIITVLRSSLGDAYLEELKLSARAEKGIVESNLDISFDKSTNLKLVADLNFTNTNDPAYTLELSSNNFNIGKILSDSELNSRFNFEMQAEGKGFDPDSLDLFLVMNMHDSFIYDFEIDSTALIVDIRRNDNGNKVINIISDIADLTISGKYSISNLAEVATAEIELIQKSILDKYSFLFPSDEQPVTELSQRSKQLLQYETINLDYLVDFKDFLTIRFNNSEVEIDGSISGQIFADEDSIDFNSTLDINYFKYWDNVNLFFLTRTVFDIDLWNKIEDGFIEDLSASVFFRSNRLYAGTNLYDIAFRTELTSDSVALSFNTKLENELELKLKSNIQVDNELEILTAIIDPMIINYNDLNIVNFEQIIIGYNDSKINFNNFKIAIADGLFSLSGDVGLEEYGVLKMQAKDIEWREIGREVLGIQDASNFDSKISLDGELSGTVSNPKLTADLKLNNLTYQEKNLGTIISSFSFEDNELYTDLRFIDSLRTFESPKLSLLGTIPLAISGKKDDAKNNELNLKLLSDNFDLASLGNAVPFVNDLTGMFNTNIDVKGTFDDPELKGTLNIINTAFTAEQNNLRYNFETSVLLDRDLIKLESLQIDNTIGTKYGGTLNGSGEIRLDQFKIDNASLTLKGDLKILDKISREANPLVYGDLVIQTDGEITLTINDQTTFVDIPINVTVADLNFQLMQSAYQNTSGFIYKFPDIIDTLKIKDLELDSLIQFAEQSKLEQSGVTAAQSFFDYRVRVNMKTEAKMVVVLSRELNQDLVAVMDGNFELTSREGRITSTGQLNLLEGSKLSFIKSFEVTGNIRVEKLENPLLDIVATYRDYYYPTDTTGTAEEIEVAVKIKFNGPLSDLAQNFIRDEENIAVYMGTSKIESDDADPTKSSTDAFLFIIAGRFTDGATTQEMNAAANTAASLAGSVLGGVLNKYLGDYVRNIQLRQVGAETKFNLIGRAGKFRYEIGGSTDVFQDLSRANVKIEFPVFQRLLLRLERKEAINETTLSNDMFNELGLKYKFEF
jgi:hypothetical protein